MKQRYPRKKQTDFGTAVTKILPLIMREFARSQHVLIFSKIPLTMSQILILEFLAEKESCKMNELAKQLNFTMSAVTAIIDKMTELKVVKREHSSTDRRVVNVIMLNKGRQMLNKIRQAKCNCVEKLFSALTQEDKNEYIRILKKVYANLRRDNE